MTRLLVAGNVGVAIQNTHRNRIFRRRDFPGPVEVRRIVRSLVLVDLSKRRADLDAVLVREQQVPVRIVQPRIEMPFGRLDRLVVTTVGN